MKKILVLGLVLALLAILVVPIAAFAGTTDGMIVGGTLTTATVSIDVPANFGFGTFEAGWNVDGFSCTSAVGVTLGTSGLTNWTVQAQGAAYMTNPTSLTDPLLIGPSVSGPWFCADGTSSGTVQGVPYSGTLTYNGSDNPGSFDFYAAQYIEPGDTTAGDYTDTITFTATCLP